MSRLRCWSKFRSESRGETQASTDNFQYQNVQVINDAFAIECLRSHNHYRALHGCPPLHLSIEVSKFSQQWAEQMAKEEHLHHSHHPQYGENLFVTYLSDNSLPMTKGSQVVESWYSELSFYPFEGPFTREVIFKAGHFTQVIWRSSRELGIGKATSKGNRVYVVANYYPTGNVLNKFGENVSKKVHSSYERQQYCRRIFSKTFDIHNFFILDNWIKH